MNKLKGKVEGLRRESMEFLTELLTNSDEDDKIIGFEGHRPKYIRLPDKRGGAVVDELGAVNKAIGKITRPVSRVTTPIENLFFPGKYIWEKKKEIMTR